MGTIHRKRLIQKILIVSKFEKNGPKVLKNGTFTIFLKIASYGHSNVLDVVKRLIVA